MLPYNMTHLVPQEGVVLSNVIFYIIWHFGLKCRTIKVFQENDLFQCKISFYMHNEDT